LHEGWEPYFEKWITEAEEKDRLTTESETKQIEGQIQETEVKLNRLLDGYLDQVIEPEIYKQKKNELYNGKLKLEEIKSQIAKNGNVWLELLFNESAALGVFGFSLCSAAPTFDSISFLVNCYNEIRTFFQNNY
jgi:hypothetical protein